jgi:hypothetical protein
MAGEMLKRIGEVLKPLLAAQTQESKKLGVVNVKAMTTTARN